MTNWKRFWASPKGQAKRKNVKYRKLKNSRSSDTKSYAYGGGNSLTRTAQKKFSKDSPVYDKYSDTW